MFLDTWRRSKSGKRRQHLSEAALSIAYIATMLAFLLAAAGPHDAPGNGRPAMSVQAETATGILSGLGHIPDMAVARRALSPEPSLSVASDVYLADLESLPPHVRRLALLRIEPRFWDMGGLYGYFMFADADVAPEMATAMGEVGIQRHRDLLQQAVALFGESYPRDRLARHGFYGWSSNADGADTDFDTRLRELSQKFGSTEAYDRAVEAAIACDPDMQSVIASLRSGLNPYQRLGHLAEELTRRVEASPDEGDIRRRMALLPRAYRLIYLAHTLRQSSNDSLFDFLFERTGTLAEEVAAAMGELGLPDHEAALREAIETLPSPYSQDTQGRRQYLTEGTSPGIGRGSAAIRGTIDYAAITEAMVRLAMSENIMPH